MMNKVLTVIFFGLCTATALGQTPAGGQTDETAPPNIVGADFLYQHYDRTDTLGSAFSKTKHRAQGAGFQAEIEAMIMRIGYRGQITTASTARITTPSGRTARTEDAINQRHILLAGLSFGPSPLKIGAGYLFMTNNRQGQDRIDNRWYGFLLGGSGGMDLNSKFSLDGQAFVAPWLKRREVTDLCTTNRISGVPVSSCVPRVRRNNAYALLVEGGATWWVLPFFGIRGGVDFLTARGENTNVPGRKENFNFLTASGGGRFRF